MERYAGNRIHRRAMEKDRKYALANQDALNYAVLCDALGVEPEDEHLYEMGYLEQSLMEEDQEEKHATERAFAAQADEKEEMQRRLENVFNIIQNRQARGREPHSLFLKN